MKYWLVKQEPEKYSFDDLMRDTVTDWTGVRNYQARNNLREMRAGDKVLFYHSLSEKAVIGLAEISKESFQDQTDETGKWLAVEIRAVEKLKNAVTLERIKSESVLENIRLIKQSRLSVLPLTEAEYALILKLSE